jgi:hypothetical protein
VHLRRAQLLAQHHDLDVVPIAADFRAVRHRVWSPELIPRGEAFATVHRACWEIVGGLPLQF